MNTKPQFTSPLKNISDTAFLVATYRAMESERADALFQDPFAAILSGEHGKKIVEQLAGGSKQSWFLVARTYILDHWILRLIKNEQIDAVLNLAAGLDTRAYRLTLPSDLKWYDVDLPDILHYKETLLKDHPPTCQLKYIKLDLSNLEARNQLFLQVAQTSQKVLVISEGFLMYLNPAQVASLAQDLSKHAQFKFWLAELIGPLQLKLIKRRWGHHFKAANAVMNFAPREGMEFFNPYGWTPLEFKSSLLEAVKINRAPSAASLLARFKFLFPKFLVKKLNTAGIALLKNSSSH